MQMRVDSRIRRRVSASKNADVSALLWLLLGQWVVVSSSCRHAFESMGGTGKDYRTALICISAGGQVLPPFLLYSGKNLMNTWCRGGPDGAQYGVTQKVSFEICSFVHRCLFCCVFLGLDR